MSEGRTAAAPRARKQSGAGRLTRAWRAMPHERRLAAYAAIGLFLTMFLPWYQRQFFTVVGGRLTPGSDSQTAWGQFSFVEAAVLLVAASVLTLLFQRAQGKAFHLPGGDGWVITVAGLWTCVLIIWRIFDKQGGSTHGQDATTYGIEWGIFVALAIAASLAYAGSRIRASHRPEPPLPGEDDRGAPRPPEPASPDPPGSLDPPVPVIRRARPGEGAAPRSPRPEPRREKGWLTAGPDRRRDEPAQGRPPRPRWAAESPPEWSGDAPPEWTAPRRRARIPIDDPPDRGAQREPGAPAERGAQRERTTPPEGAAAPRVVPPGEDATLPVAPDDGSATVPLPPKGEDPTVPVSPSTAAARRQRRSEEQLEGPFDHGE